MDNLYTSKAAFKDSLLSLMVFRSRGEGRQNSHSHEYVQMWYVRRGKCVHFINGVSYAHSVGSLFIIPPYTAHFIDTVGSPEADLIACEFAENFINDHASGDDKERLFELVYLEPVLINTKKLRPSLTFGGDSAQQMEDILLELLHEYESKDEFFNTFIRTNVLKLLALIARQYGGTTTEEREIMFSRYRAAVERTRAYIDAHYTEKIYLDDVCHIALMSPSAFSNIFKQTTGTTFTEYLLYRRVFRARELLRETKRSVTDVCLECGFNDPTYFHRVFKKITGTSPGSFRNDGACNG
ncbi:MAG: AraC family transcriptional regulator [Clostridia bacterium]